MTDKVLPQHLGRKAILYVRQSSAFQVANNLESQKLQYAMDARLRELGWCHIDVIDDDLGRSASGVVERTGFERMVAEVALGQVGAVAARELSRFARNSHDWQQLIDVCRVVNTLLIDHEAVYNPRDGNDRLLLGLKGSLNEYELDLFRQRSVEARRQKARRGELIVAAPVGFLKGERRLEKDPDQRVQQAILLVFRKFLQLGSVRQTLLWLIDKELQLPSKSPDGQTIWKRPRYTTVHGLLTNPAYGGAYAYGKTAKADSQRPGAAASIRRKPPQEWLALLPGAHEGYIDWEQFQRIGEMIAANARGGQPGAAKRGAALIAGIARCRRCGRKLVVHYTGQGHDVLRYACLRGRLDQGEPSCIGFGGTSVDRAVAREVLRVIQPAALEAAVAAQEQAGAARDEVLDALRRDLQAAEYATGRAGRQYDAVDPENRLVAQELERRWEQALLQTQQIRQRIDQYQAEQDSQPPPRREDFMSLAGDLEAVWADPGCDASLRKRIVRALLEEAVVDVDSQGGEVILLLHWKGGTHTELRLPRRRRGSCVAATPDVVEAVRSLTRVCTDQAIAGLLSRNGLRTGRGNRWTKERVASLRSHRGIKGYSEKHRQEQGWLTLTEAAAQMGVATAMLRSAVEQGRIVGEHPLADGPWIIQRKALQTQEATEVVAAARSRSGTAATGSTGTQNSDIPPDRKEGQCDAQ